MRYALAKNFFFTVALALTVFCSEASALDPRKAITQYVQDVWQDDLPQNTILSITQTRDGYIWLGTYEGVVRFDGVRFTVFDKRNTPEIKSNSIYTLYADRSSALWIGTLSGGLNCIRNGKFYNYTIADGLLSNSVRAIAEDVEGNLWVGTDRGLNLYKEGRFSSITTKDGLLNEYIRDLLIDGKGALWIATDGGLSVYKDKKFANYTVKEGLPTNRLVKLSEDRKSNIYIGTDGSGLCVFSNGKFTNYSTKDGMSGRFVYPILEDKDDNIWIGTDGGGLMRMRNGKFTAFTSKDGLTQDFVRSLYEDREGSLWIGTNGGLNRLKDGKFTSFTSKEGLTNDSIRAVFEASDKSLWIGTDAGGVCRYKDGVFTALTMKDGLPTDGIRSLYEDRDGVLWIGTNGGGLSRYKDGKLKTYTTKDGLNGDAVYSLGGDREGNLWIGTTQNGLCRFKDGKFTVYDLQDGLPNGSIRAVYEDRAGSVWFGSSGGGLIQLKDDKFIVYTMKDGLSSDFIFTVFEDSEGSLWMGTNGGLNRYKNGKFHFYTTKDGLYDDTIFQILEDDGGNLWMSCNKGIFKVNKKDLNQFDEGAVKKIASPSYGKADGMGANQCNGSSQPAGFKTRDGRLWFPTIKGLTMIDTEKIKLNQFSPPVTIEQVIADGKVVEAADRIVLGPGVETLEFQYSALSLLAPQKVKFKYKLEGFDRDWNDVGMRRAAYYTHIPPGDYRFKVIACNNDGVWNDTGDLFAFHLKPPLWRTWWAYFLYVFGIAGLGYGGVKLRVETLQRRNRMLENKVVERTAEIDKKKEELAGMVAELKALHLETERKNQELERKNDELGRKNRELEESYEKADRIFSALTEALPGTVLDGKYRLDVKVGTGGYGAVYKATHLSLNKFVAVKVFRPASGNDSVEALERFRLEGISACRINHPNAISILDSGISTESIAYLVMELLEGRSLADELGENGVLSIKRSLDVVIPVCQVLAEAHKAGIVHRDIKPENIFLHKSKEGEIVKVLDFGIAKLLSQDSGELHKLTAAGGLLGTPHYMAPERLSQKNYDGRSDVYSVGIMLYEMLCGRVPFDSDFEGLAAIVVMHLTQTPEPLRDLNPDIPEPLEEMVLKTLEKDPNNRPTAEELTQELLNFVAETFSSHEQHSAV